MGIDRTHRAIANASIIIHLTTADNPTFDAVEDSDTQHHIHVVNKIDTTPAPATLSPDTLCISAKSGIGIEALRERLAATIDTSKLGTGSVVVSNMRHYAALREAYTALTSARTAMDNGLSSDLLSEDIRRVVHYLGEITGEITSDDILHSIFSHFCIGK
jgi:tRNA modification GTPase